MSDTKTPEQMAEEYRSWAMNTDQPEVDKPGGHLALAFLAGYESARPKWISVKERLPEKTGRYLVLPVDKYYGEVLSFTKYAFNSDVRIPANSFFYDNHDITHVVDCTHWMDLPDVLKEGEK